MQISDHVIHSRGGHLLGVDDVTTVADGTRIAQQAWQHADPAGVVMHFHGGLVNKLAALKGAQRLHDDCYHLAGAYPVFSVWESGFLETIENNLGEIVRDPVFQKLVAKAAEWVAREVPEAAPGTKGSGAFVDSAKLQREFDEWFSMQRNTPPVSDTNIPPGPTTRSKEPDVDDLALKIRAQIEQEVDFQEVITGLAVESGRTPDAVARGAGVNPRKVPVLVGKEVLNDLFGPPVAETTKTKGFFTWAVVAKFVAQVVIAVIRRYLNKRDHGGYTTIVEEVLRAAYVAKLGGAIWTQMKNDTQQAFGVADGAGETVLQEWAKLAAAGSAPSKITLVGHSTGAVYINHWIRRSAQLLPALKYDLVLLAPACLMTEFAQTLVSHSPQIKEVRIFAMQDENEKKDQLVRFAYVRSLLYFVSGVVEPEIDAPMLGMQRFHVTPQLAGLAGVKEVTDYLAGGASRGIWSVTNGGAGLTSEALSHGAFDDDPKTLGSIISILKNGY